MQLFNPKFRGHIKNYFLQCLLAAAFVLLSLLIIHRRFSDLTIVSSIGASTFIAFTTPHTESSRPRYLVGGYLVGIICGISIHYLQEVFPLTGTFLGGPSYMFWCALAVGCAIFFMPLLRLQHPPAAALAMGLVIEPYYLSAAGAALISIIIVAGAKTLLKRWMIDLI